MLRVMKSILLSVITPINNNKNKLYNIDHSLLMQHTQEICLHLESEDDNEFKCKKCHKSFYTNEAKNDHVAFVHQNQKCHKCVGCGATFGFKFSLENHNCSAKTVDTNHKEGAEVDADLGCKLCGMSFESKQPLTDHTNYFHEKRKCHQVSIPSNHYLCYLCSRQ